MISLLLILFSYQSAHARWAEAKDVGAVMQHLIIGITVAADGTSTTVYEQTVRIQSEEGKIKSSVEEIEYNAFTDKVVILEAYTQNVKAIHKVAETAIEDRDKGESRDYDPIRVKSIVFPQVRVGSTLILKYKVVTSPPPIPGFWSYKLSFNPGVFIEKFNLIARSEKPLTYKLLDPRGKIKVKRTYSGSILARLRAPQPGQVIGEKDPFFDPSSASIFFLSTEPEWDIYFGSLTEDFEKAYKQPLPDKIKSELAGWNGMTNSDTQLLNVLTFMSRQFRYFGDWRRVRGGFVPRPIQEVENSRYGDCKDLSTFLAVILRNLGYTAHVALVERGISGWLNKPPDPVANVSAFNHAIVKATRNGVTYWLDPTNSVVSTTPYADIAGKPAWVLAKGTKTFERVPPISPDQYSYFDQEVYSFQKNDVAVNVTANYGKQAAMRVAYGFLTNPRDKVLFDVVDYYSEEQEIREFKFHEAPSKADDRELKDLHFDFTYFTPAVTYSTAVGMFFPLRDGGLSGAFYETSERESDLQLAEMPLIHHSIKILKNVKGQGQPTSCEIQSQWLDMKRDVVFKKNDIEIKQVATIKIPVVRKEDYRKGPFKSLQAQARKCFYRTGLIFKTL